LYFSPSSIRVKGVGDVWGVEKEIIKGFRWGKILKKKTACKT